MLQEKEKITQLYFTLHICIPLVTISQSFRTFKRTFGSLNPKVKDKVKRAACAGNLVVCIILKFPAVKEAGSERDRHLARQHQSWKTELNL